LPISEREAKGFWKKHVTTMTAEYKARKAIPGKNEAFIQGLRDKNKVTPKVATSTTPTKSLINDEPTIRGPEFYDDPDTWKDIGPAKAAPKPAVVPTPKPAVTSGKPLQLTEYDLSKTVRDGMGGRPSATPDNPKFPARPWYGGKSHAEMGLPVDKDGHLIKIKRPETAKPQADIELKKSAILSKESGKPTFTTKGKKVKTAIKKGGTLLKGPGSTTLNALSAFTLLSPVIGAFGAVVQEQKRDEEAQAAYPLHPPKQKSLWSRFANMKGSNYSQALMHRLIPEEIYGKEGYSSLKKVKEFRRKGGRTMRDPI